MRSKRLIRWAASAGIVFMLPGGFAPLPAHSAEAVAELHGSPAQGQIVADRPGALAAPKPKPKPKPKRQRQVAAAAPPQPCAPAPGVPAAQMTSIPWAQVRLGFARVFEFTRGEGVTVATVDSGVDTSHPQLDHVLAKTVIGKDPSDCIGHGTAVAGIIGAKDMRGQNIPFVGVAPAARLISVKYTVTETSDGADPNLAKAIRLAVDLKARVINVSVTSPDNEPLRRAVQYAKSRDVLIVAASGNTDPNKKDHEQELYPASYPGVLSVGSVGRDGSVSDFSNAQSKVAVTAPGSEIASTWPKGYNLGGEQSGTSFAAPYVAGVAALVRSYHPKLTSQQTLNRIVQTASGSNGTGSGAGIINPYLAVTALVDNNRSDVPQPGAQVVAQPLPIGGPPPPDRHARAVGAAVAGGTLLAALLAAFAGFVIPQGRRRNWRPGRRAAGGTDS